VNADADRSIPVTAAPAALAAIIAQFVAMPVDFSDCPVIPEELDPTIAHAVGAAARKAGEGDLAGAWEEVVDLPVGFEADYLRGKLKMAAGKWDEAVFYLSRGVTAFAAYGEAWFLLGVCRYKVGLFTDASQCFLTAVRVNKEHKDATLLWNLAQTIFHKLDQSLDPDAQSVLPLVEEGIVGLDIGCGSRKTHPWLTGVDLMAPGSIGEKASVKGLVCAADIQASGDDLSMYADESVDLIVARHNLEHYLDPVKTLLEWRRVLRPGGIVGVVLPDDEAFDTIHADETHLHTFTKRSFDRIVARIDGLSTVYTGVSAPIWSFVSVVRKDGGGECDYPALVEAFRGRSRPAGRRIGLVGGGPEDEALLTESGVAVVPLPTPDGLSGQWMFETLLREEGVVGVVTVGVDPAVSRLCSFARTPVAALVDGASADPSRYLRRHHYATTIPVTSRMAEGGRLAALGARPARLDPAPVDPGFFDPATEVGDPISVAVVAGFDPTVPPSRLADELAPSAGARGVDPNPFFALAKAFGDADRGEGSVADPLVPHFFTLQGAGLSGPWLAELHADDLADRRSLSFLERFEAVDIAFFHHLPPVERRAIYRQAAVTLVPPGHPDRIDPTGFEAMAGGGAVALPDTPLYRAVVEEGEALFYPPDDPVAAGELVAGLLADERRRKRMAAAGRKGALERFTAAARWGRIATLLAEGDA
jgi:glycosyltransferase involved in cell wall biosynthesis/SAM-dependent methyltransferase